MAPSGDAGSDRPGRASSDETRPRLEVVEGGRRESRDPFMGKPEALGRWLSECRSIELRIRAYFAKKNQP